jgi:hypothetical protein
VHAVVGQDVVAAFGTAAARCGPTRTMEKSEVPPPMSATSTQLFARDAALVVQRRGDGLVLELHVAEADLLRSGRRAAWAARRAPGRRRRRTPGGPARRDPPRGRRRPRPALQVPQVAGDHVAVAHRTACADVGALVQQVEPRMLFIERISRPSMPST